MVKSSIVSVSFSQPIDWNLIDMVDYSAAIRAMTDFYGCAGASIANTPNSMRVCALRPSNARAIDDWRYRR